MKKESSRKLGNRGQVLVEYILLLVIVVTIYITMAKLMIARDPGGDPNNSGFVISAWNNIISTIGQDYADDSDP